MATALECPLNDPPVIELEYSTAGPSTLKRTQDPTAGLSTSKNSKNSSDEAPSPATPRTALEEFGKVPVIVDTVTCVCEIHGTFSSTIPFYSWFISVILQIADWALQRAKDRVLFQWIIEFGDCMMLGLMDFLKINVPEINLPSKELFEKIDMHLKKHVVITLSLIASYSVPQKICRIAEYMMKLLEKLAHIFTIDKEGSPNIIWCIVPNLVLGIYDRTVNRMLVFGIFHVHRCRMIIRTVRKVGGRINARDSKIQCRRKVSPRKSSKTKPWFVFRCLIMMKNKVLAVLGITEEMLPPCFIIDQYLADSPNQGIPSEKKKRKLSAVEEETTCSSEEEEEEESWTHYMLNTLTSYTSGDDPDYVPTGTTTETSDDDLTDEEDGMGESSLESLEELAVLKARKEKANATKIKTTAEVEGGAVALEVVQNIPAIAIEHVELQFLGERPELSMEHSDKSDSHSTQSKEGAKSTSTPETRKKSILRW